jgi:serine/threonine-protein kinase
MEYLEGITLEAKIRREGAISPERAIDYVLQACDGLREVHTAGIVHRDVKPENLFLASTGGSRKEVVKIVDFGIAKRLDATRAKIVTGPQDRIGSPCYMSPEQMASPKTVDPRTDVWALGVVLYQSLTGRLPFDGNTLEEMFERIASAEVVPPSTYQAKVDFGLDAIVARCLKKDPNDRFQSIEELAAELERFRSPAEWRASTVDEQIWQAASRSDAAVVAAPRPRAKGPAWPVAIAAVFGAAVTIAGTVLVWTSRDSDDAALASQVPATPDPTDVKPAKNPTPAMMQPLGAVLTKAEGLAPPAEPTEAPAIVAEREVKRNPAELAKRRRQARARAQAAAARGQVPVAAPAAAPEVPVAPAEPAPQPAAARTEDDVTAPTGDDSYPDYLKRNGWRPLRDVLTEIDKSHPEPPQRAAGPEAPPPTPPAPPAEQPEAPDPGSQPEP